MPRSIRLANLVLLLAWPTTAVAVAPWLSGWHWTIDLLACFVVQAMGALTLAALALFALRRRGHALAMLAFAALAAVAVLPGLLRSPPAAPAGAAAVQLLSLNLQRGSEAAAPRAVVELRSRNADLVFCSELTPDWLAGLAADLAPFAHRCVRADAGYFGVGLFSRWPLVRSEVIPLGYDWAPAIRAVVATPAGELGVLCVHTPRPGGSLRNHERDRALAAIAEAIAPLPKHRVVLGDCNTTPWNAAFRDLLAATGLQPARTGHWAPTWPAVMPWFLRLPIDHVLVGGGIGVASFTAGDAFGSDHLPVFAVLQVPRP